MNDCSFLLSLSIFLGGGGGGGGGCGGGNKKKSRLFKSNRKLSITESQRTSLAYFSFNYRLVLANDCPGPARVIFFFFFF